MHFHQQNYQYKAVVIFVALSNIIRCPWVIRSQVFNLDEMDSAPTEIQCRIKQLKSDLKCMCLCVCVSICLSLSSGVRVGLCVKGENKNGVGITWFSHKYTRAQLVVRFRFLMRIYFWNSWTTAHLLHCWERKLSFIDTWSNVMLSFCVGVDPLHKMLVRCQKRVWCRK